MLKNIFPISDFLYLLQLEEYETGRYFKTIRRFFWGRNLQKRGRLVWTKRIKITAALAFPLCILLFPFTPIWIGISNAILNPYFERIKLRIQKQAAEKFKKLGKDTKVILIAGSHGKTTTKNYIYELIRYNYKTQMIPGNINTVTGIANWIINNFDKSTEILVAETDPYYVGEIKKVCEIIPPDISILTNIGDQHLERLGTKKNLNKALEEIFKYAKPDALKIKDLKTPLDYSKRIAVYLKIPKDIINDTLGKLKFPDRRGDIKKMHGFDVIDQSYNISELTAIYNLKDAVLRANIADRKLIVITAGIPELGEENKDANKRLGKYLAEIVDKVILLKSILYKDVYQDSEKFILADNLNAAWKILADYNPDEYFILMLPELNDLYY